MFIGNLSFQSTEEEVRELLAAVDPGVRVRIGKDRMTGKARGFAFAEFADAALAAEAIRRFNGADLRGRPLRLNDAADKPAPRAPRPMSSAAPGPSPAPRFDATASFSRPPEVPAGRSRPGGHRRFRGGKRTLN